MAKLQDIMASVRSLIAAMPGVGTVYDTFAAPNLPESEFPLVVFRFRGVGVETAFGDSIDRLVGLMSVYHYTLAANGPGPTRELSDKTFEALHRIQPGVPGFADVQLRCLTCGPVDAIGEGMYAQADDYEIRAGASA